MWAAYILVSSRVGRVFSGTTGLVVAMWVSVVVALPIGIADGGAHLLTCARWLIGGAVGVLSSAMPYTFELEALRRLATHVFGVLMSLEPAVAASPAGSCSVKVERPRAGRDRAGDGRLARRERRAAAVRCCSRAAEPGCRSSITSELPDR